jgi:drug/metabolite transporter (DMT)-like permease
VAIAAAFPAAADAGQGHGKVFARHWPAICAIGGLLNSGIPFFLFAFALLSITTGLSAILNATVPLFGALVAWLWLKDRPAGARILGLVIGFAGVAMLAWDKASFRPDPGGIAPAWAVLACLLATVCYAIAASAPSATSPACRTWSPPPAARSARPPDWHCPRPGSGRSSCRASRPGSPCWWSASCAPAWPTCCTSG